MRLLDDETPEVRIRVAARLAMSDGDLSDFLSTNPHQLSATERSLLVELLRPARRKTLVREWLIPTGGSAALQEDWDTFEALLRSISDFLHDGITVRQPLSDALDLLAEEATEQGIASSNELSAFLFQDGRLAANQADYQDPCNSDLAWVIAEGRSNPLGLSLIFMLVARRLELVVEAVNFPNHFLCRIYEDGFPIIIDCFDQGRMHLQATLLEDPGMGRAERAVLKQTADLGTILLRLLNNMVSALEHAGRDEDVKLVKKLRSAMK